MCLIDLFDNEYLIDGKNDKNISDKNMFSYDEKEKLFKDYILPKLKEKNLCDDQGNIRCQLQLRFV